MDKSYKIYKKALNEYNKGHFKNALELSEKSISESLNCSPALNLKGLLLYLNGDLSEARTLWKMNYDMNRDSVSQKYLKDTEGEEKKKAMFGISIDLIINQLRINEALILLKECANSDFNLINVDNYMALCYLKQGETGKAEDLIKKVLSIDKRNKMALDNRKFLRNFNDSKRPTKPTAMVLVLMAAILTMGIVYSKDFNKRDEKKLPQAALNNTVIPLQEVIPKIDQKEFPFKEVTSALDRNDFQSLYDYMVKWNGKTKDEEALKLLNKVNDRLSKEGAKYFYEEGVKYSKNEDYKAAAIYLQKAIEYDRDSYLNQHIVYMLALSLENENLKENALKYYAYYDQKYNTSGCYEETVLYKLSILNNDLGNKKESKYFAQKLVQSYPSSQYNNSILKGIIGTSN